MPSGRGGPAPGCRGRGDSLPSQRLDELPQIAEIGRTEGLKKLDAGDFFAAKKLLATPPMPWTAWERFEGPTRSARGLEAAIFADLAPRGIAEIIDEASHGDPKEWPSQFAALYKGRSVIIEAPVSAVPDPNKPGSGYQVYYPIYFGEGPRPGGKGRIDLAGFKLFELSQPKLDELKLFGARYASVEVDTTSGEWVVALEPDSGVFITHTKALSKIDWPTFEPTEEPNHDRHAHGFAGNLRRRTRLRRAERFDPPRPS